MKPGRRKGFRLETTRSREPQSRMNITVPVDLRERMTTRPEVNWSRVASDAFAAFLDLPSGPKPLTLEERVTALEKAISE
jgi:hypothetical protein